MAARDLYILYHDNDRAFLSALETRLALLEGQGAVRCRHRGRLDPGERIDEDTALARAQDLILLISPDFLAADALLRRAERALEGGPRLLPLLVRESGWRTTPLGRITPLPRDGRPLHQWPDPDTFWQAVETQLRDLLPLDSGPALAAAPPAPRHPRAAHGADLALRLPPRGDAPLPGDGPGLFSLLFPGDAWRRAALQLYRDELPPPRHPLRLRLETGDPALLALPWQLLQWQGYRLCAPEVGWTVTLCPFPGALQGSVDLPSPSRLLAVVPPGEDGEAHLPALREILLRLSPHYRKDAFLRVARGAAEAEAALASLPPDALHVAGPPDLLSSAARRLLCQRPPRLVSLCGPTVWHDTALQLSKAVPLQLVTAAPDGAQRPAATLALQALAAALGGAAADGEDPIAAVLALPPGPAAVTVNVYCSCARVTVQAVPVTERDALAHLRLDRTTQRALVYNQISDLVRSPARRGEALLCCAAPGNHVEQFGWQAADYLQRQHVAVRRVQVELPLICSRAALHDELRAQLGAAPAEPLGPALRRAAHNARVLFLDYGAHRPGEDRIADPQDLAAWLEFCHRDLAPACPRDLRVAAYLALELPAADHAALAEDVERWRDALYAEECRCLLLPPLGTITRNDLRDFFSDPGNSSCPPALAAEIADLVHREAGGHFEETIAWIRRAEAASWYDVRDELRRRHGAPPTAPRSTWKKR